MSARGSTAPTVRCGEKRRSEWGARIGTVRISAVFVKILGGISGLMHVEDGRKRTGAKIQGKRR